MTERGSAGPAAAGPPSSSSLPGDDLVANPNMVFNRTRVISASAAEIWPWLVQLGKQRAGWYMTSRAERVVPASRRAARVIDPRWQELRVGLRIPDYGGRHAFLEVAILEPGRALVYRSARGGATFSWALILDALSPTSTRVHLRFRGRVRSGGWRRRLIGAIGGEFDRVTSELMLSGLAERVRAHSGLGTDSARA
ncbi:MAG TPA: hypothetical protein VN740_00540 [Solirubrobacteraceae bacterium]|nr:hypothetical protein [Solirubrobacteraceae bacterium]